MGVVGEPINETVLLSYVVGPSRERGPWEPGEALGIPGSAWKS